MAETIRVLVVEDDADLRAVLVGVLAGEGYEVAEAGDGTQALALARGQAFDLVVADVRMEGLSGLDVIERVQSEKPETRSLVITGYANEEDSIRAIRLGVGDYLRKPFRMAEFRASVASRVAERRQQLAQAEREDTLRRVALQAVRELVKTRLGLDPAQVGPLVGRLCRGLGEVADLGSLELSGWLEALDWPEPFARLSGRPAQIMAVARAAAALLEQEEPASLALEVSRRHPGEFEPTVVQALDRDAPAQARGLLTLARALEQAGDTAGAAAAYRETATGASREAISACLGLSRLETERRPWLQRALELARGLGPAATGSTALEAGLISLQAGDPAAVPLLEDALRTLLELGLVAAAAQARLGLAAAQRSAWGPELEGSLGVLLRAEHRRECAACGRWLLPFLLETQAVTPSPSLEDGLRRLLGELPARAETLSPAARRVLEGLASPEAPSLRIFSLGAFEVMRGEDRVSEADWNTKKVKYLFAYLCARGRRVSEDALVEEFWPGDGERGRRSLNSALSRLRKSLPWVEQPVVRKEEHVQLNPELRVSHDLVELEELLKAGQDLERARRVSQLYRGPYLDGCYMEWAMPIRTRLEREVAALLFALAGWCRGQGRLAEAQEYVQRTLDIDPCHQEGHRLAIEVFGATGRPEEAVRQFERAERMLRQHLDMLPSLELVEAYHRARLSL